MRGDDAAALAFAVRGCGVSAARLLKPHRGRRPLLAEVCAWVAATVTTRVSLQSPSCVGGCLGCQAAARGAATCVALLVDAFGADVNDASDGAGSSALHLACWGGHCAAAQALVARGANPRTLNKWAETPAGAARARGFEHCAQVVEAAVEVEEGTEGGAGQAGVWRDDGTLDANAAAAARAGPVRAAAVAEALAAVRGLSVAVVRGGPWDTAPGTEFALNVQDGTRCEWAGSSRHRPQPAARPRPAPAEDARAATDVCAVPVLRIGRANDGNDAVTQQWRQLLSFFHE